MRVLGKPFGLRGRRSAIRGRGKSNGGNILVVVYEIDGAKNDVIMDMAFINVRRQNIFMLAFGNSVGKLPPDLMGGLRVGFPRFKGLYQVKG